MNNKWKENFSEKEWISICMLKHFFQQFQRNRTTFLYPQKAPRAHIFDLLLPTLYMTMTKRIGELKDGKMGIHIFTRYFYVEQIP